MHLKLVFIPLVRKKKIMHQKEETLSLLDKLISPLKALMEESGKRRNCPALEDKAWIRTGLLRVLSSEPGGRGFLQQLTDQLSTVIPHSSFFKTRESKRRLAFCQSLNETFARDYGSPAEDPLSGFESLEKYDLYAGDGHYRMAGTHDKYIDEKKYAVGHFYTLNLRSNMLTHLDSMVEEPGRKKEHDMHLLKRMSIKQLRQGASKGRKVLYIWDKAGIDLAQWYKWKQGSGIYFLSLEKENMRLTTCGKSSFDLSSPTNAGVIADEWVGSANGVMIRRISYQCGDSDKVFRFLTNVMDVEPGLIAQLYKMRWNIEKTFDELKTKLSEKKAWGSGTPARNMQAQFTCLLHNLMVALEKELEQNHDLHDQREITRRKKRFHELVQRLREKGKPLPLPQQHIPRATQRTLRFIRWLRNHCWLQASWLQARVALKRIYAQG